MNAIWKRKISFRVNDYWVKKDQSIKEIRLCGILSDDVSKTEVQSHIFFSFSRPLLLPCTSCDCWLPEQTCEFRFWSTGSMFTDDSNHFERLLNSNVSELSRISLCKCSCSFFLLGSLMLKWRWNKRQANQTILTEYIFHITALEI